MRSVIQSIVSYFEKKAGTRYLTAVDSPPDTIISGYSYPVKKNQNELTSQSCNRRQVGILYADVAEYSRLTEQDEEGTHHRLVESMKIMEACIFANNGKVAHFAGDAILAEFMDADKALSCAINMQLSNRRRNAGLNSNLQIRFRIGVNFGDVIADQGDIYGNAVNLTARLEKLAHTGGICVSESVRLRLKNHPSYKFIAMGQQYVKNINDPVQAFWIEFGAERIEQVERPCVANV